MPQEEIKDRLRLALSYVEKVRRLEADCQQARDARRIEADRYTALREFYGAHREIAHAALVDARQQLLRRVQILEQKITALEDERAALSDEVAAGGVDIRQAAQRNRELEEALHTGHREIERLQRWHGQSDAHALGGFVDMPLEQYRGEAESIGKGVVSPGRVPAFVVPFLVAAAVFLPWLRIQETVRPLYAIGSLFTRHDIRPPIPDLIMDMVWLVFFILPLIALPFAALDDHRRAGRGLIATGFACVAIVLAGTLVLAFTVAHPAMGLLNLVSGLRIGALAYMTGGILLVLIGRRHLGASREHRGRSLRTPALTVAGVIAVVLIAMVVLSMERGSARIHFQSGMADPSRGIARLVCRNEGERPGVLHVPWAQGIPGGEANRDADAHFGFSVYVRESGEDTFRLVPQSEPCWTLEGMPAVSRDGVRLEPQLAVSMTFDARQLQGLGIEADEVHVVLTDARGSVLGDIMITLPSALPPPPSDVVAVTPEPEPQPDITEPAFPISPLQPAPSVADEPEPEPIRPPTAAAPPAPWQLRMVARVEDDQGAAAVITISREGQAGAERVTVRLGDLILQRYIVEEIRDRPAEVTLIDSRTNQRLTLSRRMPATVPFE